MNRWRKLRWYYFITWLDISVFQCNWGWLDRYSQLLYVLWHKEINS